MAVLNQVFSLNHSCHYEDPLCLRKTQQAIHLATQHLNPGGCRELVFLCIGTDRATGDCLGPLVGTRLLSLYPKANVYGTLAEPTHAQNISDVVWDINRRHEKPLIIAVDACLGQMDRVGYINVRSGSLKPGTALKKDLPAVGDFHLSGVVNMGGFLDQMVLQNTRLYVVYQMADTIARSIFMCLGRQRKDDELFTYKA